MVCVREISEKVVESRDGVEGRPLGAGTALLW